MQQHWQWETIKLTEKSLLLQISHHTPYMDWAGIEIQMAPLLWISNWWYPNGQHTWLAYTLQIWKKKNPCSNFFSENDSFFQVFRGFLNFCTDCKETVSTPHWRCSLNYNHCPVWRVFKFVVSIYAVTNVRCIDEGINSNKPHDFHSLLHSHSPPQSILYKLNINSGYQKLFKLTPKFLYDSVHNYTCIYRVYVIYIPYIIIFICILYNKLYFIVLCVSVNAFIYTLHFSSFMLSGMLAWNRELSAK
jgi:hypothetical protein